MPSSRPARRFDDTIDNVRSILQDVEGMMNADFTGDRLVQDAVLYRLLRISEAAKKLGATAKSLAPDQPWDQIRAFGNAIRYDYD